MLFGSKVFISLARDKHREKKQPKAKPTQAAKTPGSPNVAAKGTPTLQYTICTYTAVHLKVGFCNGSVGFFNEVLYL